MINDALRLIRQYHNIDQTQLAGKLSVSTSYLSEIEAGRKEPTLDLIQRYATFFNVSLSSLVIFSETIDGSQNKSTVRSFVSKKMLKILKWIADDDQGTIRKDRKI